MTDAKINKNNTDKATIFWANPWAIIAGILFCLLLFFGTIVTIIDQKRQVRATCEKAGKVYDESQRTCRTKTTSEKFDEKCSGNTIVIDGKFYSCSEIKNLGLEKAYLENMIVKHGETLYERGTDAEITAGKQAGKYCLSAGDTWNYIGEKRCVVFSYEYMTCSGGYCYLDEKKNYINGFVTFFSTRNMYSWESFRSEYDKVKMILVCGTITAYQGHPQIKVTNPSKQIVKNPIQSYGSYPYSCKATQ